MQYRLLVSLKDSRVAKQVLVLGKKDGCGSANVVFLRWGIWAGRGRGKGEEVGGKSANSKSEKEAILDCLVFRPREKRERKKGRERRKKTRGSGRWLDLENSEKRPNMERG